ncbi:MAG: PKD domain-containing protein [Bacteroidetes bacterium]|nr:PKD domain-containing protein [Bacteroidota bacterium]
MSLFFGLFLYTSGNQNIIKTFTVGSTFNALSDLYLNSVLVHEVGTGYVVINIHNRAGSLVASKSTYVVGYSGGALKSVIIPLGFSIPKDSGYIMDASGSTVFGMYMVSPSSYPYIIPNIIKLTGNTLSTKEVYYFYNWNVSTHQSCPSKRVAVKADIEGIKADYFSRPNCNSKSVSFDDISTYGVGKFSSRKWDFGDGTSDTSVSPFHVYPAATLYQAKLIINSKSGCKDSVIYPLSFYPAPKPNFSFTDECIKNANTFVDSTKGLSSRLWRLGDGATDTSKYQSHIYSKPGVYNVSLLGTITNGCSDSTTKSAKVFGYPSAKFTSTILSGGSYKFTPDVSGYSVYKWNFGDGIGKSNLQNPTYKFPTSGSYTVKLFVDSAGNGCTDSDSTTIVVTSIHSESNNFNFSIYPNPFSESTNIHYSLTQKKHIKIYITDVLGRTICTLADANQNAGEYNIDVLRFENVGHLNMNQGGVYFVHFNVGDECIVTRIVMVK